MAKGHFRRQRYIVRIRGGRGIGASSVAQVVKLAKKHEVEYIETETGDMKLEDLLKREAE